MFVCSGGKRDVLFCSSIYRARELSVAAERAAVERAAAERAAVAAAAAVAAERNEDRVSERERDRARLASEAMALKIKQELPGKHLILKCCILGALGFATRQGPASMKVPILSHVTFFRLLMFWLFMSLMSTFAFGTVHFVYVCEWFCG